MKTKIFAITLAVLSVFSIEAEAQKKKKKKKKHPWYFMPVNQRIPKDLKGTPDSEVRLNQWYKDAKYGAFIHFGAYSMLGGSYKGRGQQYNYAEWIMLWGRIPPAEYRKEVVAKFNPSEFDAEEWVKTFKSAGLKYVVLTAKHHEGLAMYHSKVTDYNIVDATEFKRDIVQELADACKKYDMHFGLYYSHAQDWSTPNAYGLNTPVNRMNFIYPELSKDYKPNHEEYMRKKSIPQLEELVKNYPVELLWFDTPNRLPIKYVDELYKIVRKYRPNCLINSRLIKESGEIQTQESQKYIDYMSLADKQVPKQPLNIYFETPDSVTHSYGYKDKGKVQYHSLKGMIQRLVNTVCSGGNYLLNNGPMGNGKLDPKAVDLYKGIGKWLKVNGASIYNTRKNPLKKPDWGNISVSKDGSVYYLHVLSWPKDKKITVSNFDKKVKKVSFLANSQALKSNINNSILSIELPSKPTDLYDVVIKVETK